MAILEMIVNMDCPGCESKVKKALQKLDGVDNIDIDMDLQKVTVTGWAEQEEILKAVRKTGKKVELWPFPYIIPAYHSSSQYYYDQYNYHSDPSSYFTSEHPSADQSYYDSTVSIYEYQKDYGNYEYNYHDHQSRRRPNYSGSVLDERSTNISMFSDENVNACSIM